MSLQKTIEAHLAQFAESVLAAVRAIKDLTNFNAQRPRALSDGQKHRRLRRRSRADIDSALARIVALLQDSPEGIRAEELKVALGLHARELPRPLAEGLASGRLVRTGQRRTTVYAVGSAASGTTRKKRVAKASSGSP
jgi:hypothetical protein